MENISEEKNENESEYENESEESDENEEEEEDNKDNSSDSTGRKGKNNNLERAQLLFSSGSIKNISSKININNEKSLMERLPSFGLKRKEKKNYTILFQTKASLNSQNIHYPLDNLKPIPIITSSQKELVYLYLTEDERDFLLKKLDTNNY